MKIALIGATGFVGSAMLKELTDRGHEVTAVARQPENLAVKGPLVHPVAADIGNVHQIADLVKGCDAVYRDRRGGEPGSGSGGAADRYAEFSCGV
jgi:uncharacterized protein